MKYDYLVVGAGFSGAVLAERIASELGKRVLVIDKRNHIGGNCYDYADANGIFIHKYGPHAFHTRMEHVWAYLSRFTEWKPYSHRVLAKIGDKHVPVPFNLDSIDIAFEKSKADEFRKALVGKYGMEVKVPILNLMQAPEPALRELADFVYKNIFEGYTVKQWGLRPEEIDPSVTSRVPVFVSRDSRYFQDEFQAMPAKGYAHLFDNMLRNDNIELRLNCSYEQIRSCESFDKLIWTGPIDQFYDCVHGALPYRSLEFEIETLDREYFQKTAQLNYPNDFDYTRTTEFKHFLGVNCTKTTIAYERASKHVPGSNEPYYPIQIPESEQLYAKYKELAAREQNVFFAGRLAEYKYLNMDQVVSSALATFLKLSSSGRR